jgi:hypothetical protein
MYIFAQNVARKCNKFGVTYKAWIDEKIYPIPIAL